LGVKKELILDKRIEEDYKFESLKKDPTKMTDQEQRRKIKTLAEKYDPPKRVEIKELELLLKHIFEFQDVETKRKINICREVAFIIKDLAVLYNMCYESSEKI
jgi:hypothetical protein